MIKELLKEGDTILLVQDFNGSMIVIIGEASDEVISTAAKIAIRYSKGKDEPKATVRYSEFGSKEHKIIEQTCATDEEINSYLI